MSGAGKWIKKHPIETLGILAAGVTGGASLGLFAPAAAGAAAVPAVIGGAEGALGAAEMAMLGESAAGPLAANGLMPGLGPMSLLDSAGPQYAALNAQGFNPTMASWADKMSPYAKLAGQAQGLLGQDPQQMPPMQQRPQMMAQGGGGAMLPYGDPLAEEERRRRMAATGRFYG
jgi:hypothetical protein